MYIWVTISTGEVTIHARFLVEMAKKMLTSSSDAHQTNLFGTDLLLQLDPDNPLLKLSCVIPWQKFDQNFTTHYAKGVGAPSNPIRLMVGLLLLKQLEDLTSEFTHTIPCRPNKQDLTLFPLRGIGKSLLERGN